MPYLLLPIILHGLQPDMRLKRTSQAALAHIAVATLVHERSDC